MGVRYVVVPSTQGRDGGAQADAPVALRAAPMAQQLDLARLRSSRGLVLYENLAVRTDPRRGAAAGAPGRFPPSQPRRARDRPHVRGAAPGSGPDGRRHRLLGRGLRLGVEGDGRR